MNSRKEDDKKYVLASKITKEYGMSLKTLKRYAEADFIRYIKSKKGRRRYHIDDGPKIQFIFKHEKFDKINLKEKELIYLYKNDVNMRRDRIICYSRVKDESENNKLIYEKKLFEKHIKDGEIIQEYGGKDDIDSFQWMKIIERCENKEIKYIFVISFDSIGDDLFHLVKTLLDIYRVDLYIVKKDGKIVDSPDSEEDMGSIIRIIQFQRERLLN